MSLIAACSNSVGIALIFISIFWKIGDFPDLYGMIFSGHVDEARRDLTEYITNITGLAFMLSCMMSVSSSSNVIMQVPLQAPVMERELASKMYSPTAYFIGCFMSTLIVQFIHPVILFTGMFFCIGIDTSFQNYCWVMAYAQISNFLFCGQGYLLGILVTDENDVKLVNLLFLLTWTTGTGILCNLSTANWFVRGLSHVSPGRYNTEGFVRCLTRQVPDLNLNETLPLPVSQQDILKQFEFTWGEEYCLYALIIWFFALFAMSLIAINLKYRKF